MRSPASTSAWATPSPFSAPATSSRRSSAWSIPTGLTAAAIRHGERLKWVSTIYAGLDAFPLDALKQRGTILTNGTGINALAVAEYAVLGVLAAGIAATVALGAFVHLRDTDELVANWAEDRRWTPAMAAAERSRLIHFWKKAVTRTFDWVE